MKKGFLIVLMCFCFALAFVVISNGNYWNSELPSKPTPTLTPMESFQVKGKIICLPHKDTSGPITLECAFGIKDNKTGLNYALNFPETGDLPPTQNGEIVVIKGEFTPVSDTVYDIAGRIEVESVQN